MSNENSTDLKQNLIVVDDNEEHLELIHFLLKDEGFNVITTTEISIMKEIVIHKPCILLIDEWMPVMKGSEICKRLKSDPLTTDIPVILISAVMNLESIAADCCADAFIPKPYEIDNLIKIIKSFSN
jgi:CheY-like chemotaxis protein